MNISPASLHIPLRRQLSQCLQLGNRSNSFLLLLLRQHQQQQRRLLSSCRTLRSPGTSHARGSARTQQQFAAQKRSIAISAVGIVACAVAMYGVIHLDMFAIPQDGKGRDNGKQNAGTEGGIKLDGPNGLDPNPITVKIDKPNLGDDEEEEVGSVPTGNSTIPTFPEKLHLPSSLDTSISPSPPVSKAGDQIPGGPTEEYHLLGLGTRTVSFLGIQVYVVGLYIAQADIPALQQRLIHQAVVPPTSNSSVGREGTVAATSLVPAERESLQKMLLDPEQSERTWDEILKDGGIRTAFRIVPTRNTDFLHLRDGWVRSVTAKAQKANARAKEAAGKESPAAPEPEFADDSFGNSMNEFKTLFGGGVRKNVPKGQTLLLLRDRQGVLDSVIQPAKKEGLLWLGRVSDERISRLLWMVYLSGKTVASEDARKSVVDGMMEIVRRPVGTLS